MTQSSQANSVPQVPGAGRNRPLPKPKEMMRGADLNTQAAVGWTKGSLEGELFLAGIRYFVIILARDASRKMIEAARLCRDIRAIRAFQQ